MVTPQSNLFCISKIEFIILPSCEQQKNIAYIKNSRHKFKVTKNSDFMLVCVCVSDRFFHSHYIASATIANPRESFTNLHHFTTTMRNRRILFLRHSKMRWKMKKNLNKNGELRKWLKSFDFAFCVCMRENFVKRSLWWWFFSFFSLSISGCCGNEIQHKMKKKEWNSRPSLKCSSCSILAKVFRCAFICWCFKRFSSFFLLQVFNVDVVEWTLNN